MNTNGYCVFLGLNLVSWSSTKQRVISKNSVESKYCGLTTTTVALTWSQFVLKELCIPQVTAPILWCDNQNATHLTVNPISHAHFN